MSTITTAQAISVTITKDDLNFTYYIPVGTTWANAVDAAHLILTHVGELAKQSLAASQSMSQEATEVIEPILVEGN
jgi:hypothetical protein